MQDEEELSTFEYLRLFEMSLAMLRKADQLRAAVHPENGAQTNYELIQTEADLRFRAVFLQRGLVCDGRI